MAHEIEIDQTTGTAAFAASREPAWHRLGTVADHDMTIREGLAAAHLAGWDVRLTEMSAHDFTGNYVARLDVPDHRAVVRTNPFTSEAETLGVVGKGFRPLQNEQVAAFAEAILDADGIVMDACGSIRGGREVFMTVRLPEGMSIGGQDEHDMYLAMVNGHDGSRSLSCIATPVRVVCANTVAAAERVNAGVYTVKHTAQLDTWSPREAQQALQVAGTYRDRFAVLAEQLLAEPMGSDEFDRFIDAHYTPEPDETAGITARNNRDRTRGKLRWLFNESDTQANCRNTRWGAYNAVAEWREYYTPRTDQAKVATSVLLGSDAAVRGHAFRQLLAV